MSKNLQIVQSLADIMNPDIEAMLAYATERNLVDEIAIGVLYGGQGYIRLIGPEVTQTSCFELGSLTKIFTIELVDILAKRGLVHWDDPVIKYFPERLLRTAAGLQTFQATLLDVATHCSGLPRLPDNLKIRDSARPYETYRTPDLEVYLLHFKGNLPTKRMCSYSNLGFAILGYALENATKMSYAALLQNEILGPMDLSSTFLSMTNGSTRSRIQGHTQSGRPTPAWGQDAFAPAGALCSNIMDLLHWIAMLLESPNRTLFDVFRDTENKKIGLGWSIHSLANSYVRTGTTGGFCSYLGLSPDRQNGVVLLLNRQCNALMESLAENFERCFRGESVVPLRGDYGMLKAKAIDPLRYLKHKAYAVDLIWKYLKA